MTIEQMSKLSDVTEIASATNDIDTLKKVWTIIQTDEIENGPTEEGAEWFMALISTDQFDAIRSKN
jgi:hypothetical protein